MKCIKAIRETKEIKLGTIKRVDDKTAMNMVGSSWEYVSKSEWKSTTRINKPVSQVPTEADEQSSKKLYKKGERSEKHKNKK